MAICKTFNFECWTNKKYSYYMCCASPCWKGKRACCFTCTEIEDVCNFSAKEPALSEFIYFMRQNKVKEYEKNRAKTTSIG